MEEEAGEEVVEAALWEEEGRESASLKSDGFWSGGEVLEGLAWEAGKGKDSTGGG